MEKITFFKMSGSGNDFIIIDNRNSVVDEGSIRRFIANICRRKMSVGADGVILVENSDEQDFKWRFFNSDGSVAEMCGNGARCVARFAVLNGIAGKKMSFETEAGPIFAKVGDNLVKIKMPDPADLKIDYLLELKNGPLSVSSINTGVPHVVVRVDDLEGVEVVKLGRQIRFHKNFAPAGTNVNFICRRKDAPLTMRTYERGVEDETLACGTGAVAGALITAHQLHAKSPLTIRTRSGGDLNIYFKEKAGKFYDVHLEGDARMIYNGELWEEAWA